MTNNKIEHADMMGKWGKSGSSSTFVSTPITAFRRFACLSGSS